jgi:rubrerythrin
MTSQGLTIKEALQVAITEEIKAYNLYKKTSGHVVNPGAKKMLLELAEQEKQHRDLLRELVAKDDYQQLGQGIPEKSLGISDFMATTDEIDPNASIQEVMIFAMKAEEKAFAFYSDMKQQFSGTDVENIFHRLAEEEKGHKIKLEEEYDNTFFKEN